MPCSTARPIATAQTRPVGCPFEPELATATPDKVTYNRDIAPILFANCAECHRPGEVAPFSLLSYEDASKRAKFLAEVTRSGKMPPWKAEIGHGEFLGERRLTEQQIALIETWAKAGATEGYRRSAAATAIRLGLAIGQARPRAQGWPHPLPCRPAVKTSFSISSFRSTFPKIKRSSAWSFVPAMPAVVHHAILFLDTSGVGRRKTPKRPSPGYKTSGSIGIPVAGIIGVWTPGMTPRFFPENVGLPVRKGTPIWSCNSTCIPAARKRPTNRESPSILPTSRSSAPWPRAPLVIGSLMIDIPPNSQDYTISSSVTLPIDVTLISLLPHMHLVGKEMKLTATLPDGAVKSLDLDQGLEFLLAEQLHVSRAGAAAAGNPARHRQPL